MPASAPLHSMNTITVVLLTLAGVAASPPAGNATATPVWFNGMSTSHTTCCRICSLPSAACTAAKFTSLASNPSCPASPTPHRAHADVPWNNFGADIGAGQYDADWFDAFFSAAAKNGSNVARFWLHADGRAGLLYADDGSVRGLNDSFASDLTSLARSAASHQVVLQVCLWSFDMCKNSEFPGQTLRTGLIADAAKTASYVENALKPLLAALKPPAVAAGAVLVEVINEPEWCMKVDGGCTADACVEAAQMQRFVGSVAAAVHEAGLKVTVGSSSLKWDAPGGSGTGNLWDDTALRSAAAAGVAAGAYLDLYNVHYYDWMYNEQWGYDPCREDTAYWQLDKVTVVGELPANSQKYSAPAMMACALKNGFAGDMFWAFNDPNFPVEPAAEALRQFRAAHPDVASYGALRQWLAAPAPAPTPAAPTPAPPCVDVAPDAQYTCEQQAGWGKCDVKANPWMAGYCCKTCFKCDGKCGKP